MTSMVHFLWITIEKFIVEIYLITTTKALFTVGFVTEMFLKKFLNEKYLFKISLLELDFKTLFFLITAK